MSNGPKRTRSERVAALELAPSLWTRMVQSLQKGSVWSRLGICTLTAIALWLMTAAWQRPFAYHLGDVPRRDIVSSVAFERENVEKTEAKKELARKSAYAVYDQNPEELVQLRAQLYNAVTEIVSAEKLADVEEVWATFEEPLAEGEQPPSEEIREQAFTDFKQAFSAEESQESLKAFEAALADAFAQVEQKGVLLDPLPDDKNQKMISVRPKDTTKAERDVAVSDVFGASGLEGLQRHLDEKIQDETTRSHVRAWLKRNELPQTLELNEEATDENERVAVEEAGKGYDTYSVGSVLAAAFDSEGNPLPLGEEELALLQFEYNTHCSEATTSARVARSLAAFGMYLALFTLCGFYIRFREPAILSSFHRLLLMLLCVMATVGACMVSYYLNLRAELVPLLLFGMTIAVAYHQELALLLSAAVCMLVVFSLGQGLVEMIILFGTVAAAIMQLNAVRTRSKLLYVGLAAGLVAMMTTLGSGVLDDRLFYPTTVIAALKYGMWAVIAGSLMTCLLPFIEWAFDVQTDISLIELGDPAHPLLQELVRRAPGTYNHSITVASLAEAGAEAIGARGLLVRVGAYFHDIGKMLKPGYFVENQQAGDNRHESLVPAMSTLVIIAHVKDGADLARQHHLPESIIDFIQQHHGTTLVEYFFHQANQQSEDDPDGSQVDESSFRYPGPKPQTKEAGILMLADAVESASRVLVEPTPARIEGLVHEIVMKRLLDGQFSECELSLREVHTVAESLVKSLTAIYHGRVKYPDLQPA